MNDPVRLRDDPRVSERIRSDLGHATAAMPTGLDLERGLARLEVATAQTGRGGGGSTGGIGRGLLWSASAGVVAAAAIAALLFARSSARPSSRPPRPVPAVSPHATDSPPPPETAAPSREERREPAPAEAPAAPVARVSKAPAPAAAADDRVRREIEQLAQARAELGRDPAAALALAEDGNREFPEGLLGQEREAIAILALDRLGRASEARERAGRFLEHYPRGPFTERIRSVAGGAP